MNLLRRTVPFVVIFGALASVYWAGMLERLEYGLMDLRFRVLAREAGPSLVVVEIDQRSLRELNVWPWPRRYHAQVIDRLIDAGAAQIAFDVDFSSHATPFDDQALELALQGAGGRVLLPVFKQRVSLSQADAPPVQTAPLPRFAQHARLGSVVVWPESDSRVRRMATSVTWADGTIASMATVLAATTRPVGADFYIDYGIQADTLARISYTDIYHGRFPPDFLQGRRVIVGATAVELGDQLPVPLHLTLAGPYVIALATETLLQGRALVRTATAPTLLITFLIALVLGPQLLARAWPIGLLLAAAASALIAGGALAVQAAWPVSVDTVPWLLAPWLCFAYGLVARIERQAVRIFRQRMAVLHRSATMREIVDSSFDGVLAVDHAGLINVFNPAAEEMFGYAAEEMVGRPPASLFRLAAGTDEQGFAFGDLLDPEATLPEQLDGQGLRKDGSGFVVEVALRRTVLQASNRRFERRDGGRTLTVLTVRDITARRRLEEMQQAAKEEAQAANRAKSEFLAAVSHELRTPLNAVIGFSEMIKEQMLGPIDNEQYLSYAADIHGSGVHLRAIVEDILDISKIEAGRRDLREERMSLAESAAAAVRLVGGRPDALGMELQLRVPDELPLLRGDPQALKQILLNLLTNAIKFTPKGGQVAVLASLRDDGGLTLDVSDKGIGMPAEEIPKVVQPFYQVDSSLARQYEGTGLGLSLVTSLMELHGGRLVITSSEGEGTTMSCRFPPDRTVDIASEASAVADRTLDPEPV